uniref:DM domain-containing protein n=1 Tax=Steinernema glaseri TaxID=37863 RepID=A0A1I7YNS1_9BILA
MVVDDEELQQLLMQRDEATSSSGTTCSSPELDVVGSEDIPDLKSGSTTTGSQPNEKRYFCQRCLNHGEEYPRKGHKPYCKYARCECSDCIMVERRRQLNNQLSQRRLDPNASRAPPGKKVRAPKCALCSAHGIKEPLKGHKKSTCPYLPCGCNTCELVDTRRRLMAKQIKLRRVQQKMKKQQEMNGEVSPKPSPKPLVTRAKTPESPEVADPVPNSSPPPRASSEELANPVPIRPTVMNPSALQLFAFMAANAANTPTSPFFFSGPPLGQLSPLMAPTLAPPPPEFPALVPTAFGAQPTISPLLIASFMNQFRPPS